MIQLQSGEFPIKVGYIKPTETIQIFFHIRPTMTFGTVALYCDIVMNGTPIDVIELPVPAPTLLDNSNGNAYAFIIEKLTIYTLGYLTTLHPDCTFIIA